MQCCRCSHSACEAESVRLRQQAVLFATSGVAYVGPPLLPGSRSLVKGEIYCWQLRLSSASATSLNPCLAIRRPLEWVLAMLAQILSGKGPKLYWNDPLPSVGI